eukprot:g2223.t1
MGIPQLTPSSTLPQVVARDGFDQYPASADLQVGLGGRSPDEPPYLGEALPRGGFWSGQADPTVSHQDHIDGGAILNRRIIKVSLGSSVSSGMMGYPSHGIPSLPVDSTVACGVPIPGAAEIERLPHMTGALPGSLPNLANPAIQSDLAGMGHLVAMSGLGGLMLPEHHQQTDGISQGIDGQFGFAGIMMPMQQALNQLGNAHTMASMPTQMPGYRPAGRFRGRIKSFNAKQGFGFIENPEAYAMFGRDVFLHKAQIGNLKVGMEVTYGVEMNKFGMPQARELATLDGKPPGPPPASVAKGGTKTKVSGKRPTKGKDDGDAPTTHALRSTNALNLIKVPDLQHAAVSLRH